MKRITLAWALTLCSFMTFIACSSPDVGERSVSIIPAPAQMTVGEGTFTIHPGIEIGYADESLKGMGELLSNEIESCPASSWLLPQTKNRIASSSSS